MGAVTVHHLGQMALLSSIGMARMRFNGVSFPHVPRIISPLRRLAGRSGTMDERREATTFLQQLTPHVLAAETRFMYNRYIGLQTDKLDNSVNISAQHKSGLWSFEHLQLELSVSLWRAACNAKLPCAVVMVSEAKLTAFHSDFVNLASYFRGDFTLAWLDPEAFPVMSQSLLGRETLGEENAKPNLAFYDIGRQRLCTSTLKELSFHAMRDAVAMMAQDESCSDLGYEGGKCQYNASYVRHRHRCRFRSGWPSRHHPDL